jgi:hypothetical protein
MRTSGLSRCALLLLLALLVMASAPEASRADACTPPVANPVACENTKPGADPSSWEILKDGDPSIQGFATAMSVNEGETISFKIKSDTPDFHIDILRLGYYGGKGARLIAQGLAPTGPSTQPACTTDSSTGLIDCGNWAVTRSWDVPPDAVSGVYIAHLVRNDTGGDSHIVFVVRDDASHSDIVVQTSDETWQAYNTYGGNSLYRCAEICPPGGPKAYKGAFKVSYNRPFNTEASSPRSSLFNGSEYSMIRFLEANGYDVSYISGLDTERHAQLLTNHKVFMSSGHDEYWTAGQRKAVEAARDAGVNLAFFSGNEMFWKTRWEPGGDGTPDRTLVSYKDTHFPQQMDPVEWTGTWRDPRFTTDADGVKPENAVTGQSFVVNSGTSQIVVPAAYRQLRLWRNTAVAAMGPDDPPLALAPSTLGYEWDVDADNGFRPAGAFRLSSTTVSDLEVFTDYGSTTKLGGTETHNLMMYRAPSGALVFGAGTVQWAWGLDGDNPAGTPADPTMQQATVNLFADVGAQPATLQPGLTAGTASSDTTAPTATIDPLPATVADGTDVTIKGSATDAGGGVVAGVEVSTDGGDTWHPANGTAQWSYSWTVHGAPATTVKVRAVDDSGNLEAPVSSPSVEVTCPCSLWGENMTLPAGQADAGDPSPVEVGVKFRSDRFGTVTGLRFYKSAANTGTHVGSLWTATGQRLAQATFTSETASGWQRVAFAKPVDVLPDTTYVASYYAPQGHYAATADYFYRSPAPGPNGGAIADSPPLHAVRNTGTTTNGVYAYGASSTFPVNSFSAGNYWVDVLFTPTPAPGEVTDVRASAGGFTSANVSWSAPSAGGAPTSYEVTPYIGSTAQTPKTVTGSPPSTSTTVTGLTTGTTYTFRVRAVNPNGAGALSAASNAVTPEGAVVPSAPRDVSAQGASTSARVSWTVPESDGDSAITGYTVTPFIGSDAQQPVHADASATSATVTGLTNGTAYTFKVTATNGVGDGPASAASNAVIPQATIFDFATPPAIDSGDRGSVELGVKFKADFDGSVTGIRFYKAEANTGTHVGSLWTAAGQRLAQATFTDETTSGWQTVTFASTVPVKAGTTYVASYFAPQGHYSAGGGFAAGVDNPPLHTIPNATSANGVYAYAPTSTFPSSSFNATNYWVDVLYALPEPGQVTGVSAAAGGRTSARLSWSAPASGGPVTSYRITPYIGSTAQTPTVVSGSPPATGATVTGLTTGTTYTFTVQALNANGAGPASAESNPVTPQAAVAPSTPTDVLARPATGSARVSWSTPDSDGDSPITGYTITPYVGSTAQAPVQAGAAATSATVTGLDNGTAYTFKVTASNAAGTSAPSAASEAVTPRATIFDFATPATVDSGDAKGVEVGVKFRTDFDGAVTGIRFYKAEANTGTHVGSLWSADGTRLAQATFTGESKSGWQAATFATPVDIKPNTTYVASYFAPRGHYSVTSGGLASAVDHPPLHALANTASPNGIFSYTDSGTFPSRTFGASDYGVDVLFQPAAAPGQATAVAATAGRASANVTWSAPSSGGPVTSYKVTPYIGSTPQPAKTITGSPPQTSTTITGLDAGTAYTFTVRAANPSGSGPESAPSNAITPLAAVVPSAPTGASAQADSKSAVVGWTPPGDDGGSPVTGYTVTPYVGTTAQAPVQAGASATSARVSGLTNGTSYTFRVTATNAVGQSPASDASNAVSPKASIFELSEPAVVDSADTSSAVLGVKFRADVPGAVTGIRFYKAAANTGTHVVGLYTASGTLLAQATAAAESRSGWQAVAFASPVAVTANTTYVAAYLAPNGHYSVTSSAFASKPFDNPPLHALANSTSPNGVYAYSKTLVSPISTFKSTNYWVDVLFEPTA